MQVDSVPPVNFASRVSTCMKLVEPFKHLLRATTFRQFWALKLRVPMGAWLGQYGTPFHCWVFRSRLHVLLVLIVFGSTALHTSKLSLWCKHSCVECYSQTYLHQGVLTSMSPVEALVTRIKVESSNVPGNSWSRYQYALRATKMNGLTILRRHGHHFILWTTVNQMIKREQSTAQVQFYQSKLSILVTNASK